MPNVLLVDDRPAVRRGLRMRLGLEPDITIVGEAEDGWAALVLVPALRPDVVVIDVEMPGMDGISTTAALRTIAPQVPVVVLSVHDDANTRSRALAAGAAAFVEKRVCADALLHAIRRVSNAGKPAGGGA